MTQKRRTYDAAFKRQAVKLSENRKNLSELARELGIKPHLLYNWRKEFQEFGEGRTVRLRNTQNLGRL